jgi:hypothetical protein
MQALGKKPCATPLDVETRCRRVAPEDISAVTPEDVRAVAATMTPEQFRAALRVMADNNKVGDVLMYCNPKSFSAAVGAVDAQSFRDAGYRVQASPALQGHLLAHTTDDVREECHAAQRHLHATAGDAFS